MRRIREARLTTVIAFIAGMLVATAETATAAKLITGKQIQDGSITTKDLSTSIRAQLAKAAAPATPMAGPRGAKGAKGSSGAPGAQGGQGTKGDKGDPGDPGQLPDVLPSGRTLRGLYGLAAGPGGGAQQGVSYPIPLPAKTRAAFVAKDRPEVEACKGGTVQEPRADPGWLCVYEAQSSNRNFYVPLFNEDAEFGWGGKTGFVLVVSTAGPDAGGVQSSGSWAVTAP